MITPSHVLPRDLCLLTGPWGQLIKTMQAQEDRSSCHVHPQHQAVGLEQGCPFSPAAVTSLGAHEPHYDFGLWRNFTGHFYELRGFQPGLASEAFRKLSKNTDLWAPPSPPKPVLFKSFPSDCGGQSQVWGPIIIPHSDFSDEVSNLPKLKGWFIQQIFILQLLCSRYIDLIA